MVVHWFSLELEHLLRDFKLNLEESILDIRTTMSFSFTLEQYSMSQK